MIDISYRQFKGGGPFIVLILCGFVVFTSGYFILCLTLFLMFFSLFSLVITSLREERDGLYACNAFVCLLPTLVIVALQLPRLSFNLLHVFGYFYQSKCFFRVMVIQI